MGNNYYYDSIVIGSGPAACTASIYLSRANLRTAMFEGICTEESVPGGLLMKTSVVENFPGFPEGVDGYTLMMNMLTQCKNQNVTVISEQVLNIIKDNDGLFEVKTNTDTIYFVKGIILATGSSPNQLNANEILNYDKYLYQGISTCAVCDGMLPCYRNKPLIVVGGGDSACESALYLSKTATHVYMFIRGSNFRSPHNILAKRVLETLNITVFFNTKLKEIHGSDTEIEKVIYQQQDSIHELKVNGIFVSIGHTPNTSCCKSLNVKFNEVTGHIIADPITKETNVEGLYAAGDVQDAIFQQAITAAGSGCQAALSLIHHLMKK